MNRKRVLISLCVAVVLALTCVFALPTQAEASTSGYDPHTVFDGRVNSLCGAIPMGYLNGWNVTQG